MRLPEQAANINLVCVRLNKLNVICHLGRVPLNLSGHPVCSRNVEDLLHALERKVTKHRRSNDGHRLPIQILPEDVVEVLVGVVER